jgi:predicted DsbA family dithiol-disulfide isomerase
MKALAIDIVSDVICPWCFIGTRRLEHALEPLPKDIEVTVTYHPFLLDPSTPKEGTDLRERLRRKYGVEPEGMFARVEAAARESGIPLDFSKIRRTVSTVPAHTLLRHALRLHGQRTQRALANELFGAYFLEGRDIGQAPVLADLARPHGFTPDEARRLLEDIDELDRTRQEAAAVAAKGIDGVPFFVFGGRLAVSGAQSPEVLRAAIARALGDSERAHHSAHP